MKVVFKTCLILSFLLLISGVFLWFLGNNEMLSPLAIASIVCFALGIKEVESLKNYQYTAWIMTAVLSGMLYPEAFKSWGGVNLRDKTLILIIIQFVMFGMGTHIKVKDFAGIGSTGKGVLVGLFCHFSVMPLMGFLLTRIFHFDPEIAAGIILIGSCSSGLASNVMVYLAKGNLVLSVVVTAMATLAAPFLTPLLMKLLAGTLIQVAFVGMMMEIIKIVLIPIGAALLYDFLKNSDESVLKKARILALISLIIIFGIVFLLKQNTIQGAPREFLGIFGFILGALVMGVVYHLLTTFEPCLDTWMPYISMMGIIYFTTVTTAAGRDNLLKVGGLLFVVSVIHNASGYFFGYWLARLFGMSKTDARTIAFEVGLQNGGMASGLAGTMGKLGTVGLPAAVFSPWMNISGSILANFWRKRAVDK
ncbi:bile acid:sodium symporter family protein [Flectobacillus longus]|uniref:bile acid:sodium symporter family protein n=1 Tax=Flectobacillus longus TaxID=2984207 RepID=UPI0024B7EE8A|nr:bile acid:sodium symporter family protein [Flectobacillus longus]MDI9879304.1 bile acid:sodium symporter family protein [Flectobacillus longus]